MTGLARTESEETMPVVGEIAPVIDAFGRKRGTKTWIVCPVCEVGRWVRIDSLRRGDFTGMCAHCHNKFTSGSYEQHPRWHGGRSSSRKYSLVKLRPEDGLYTMCRRTGYCLEHRIVMARYAGRCLKPWEIVHHKNADTRDNRIENLELLPSRKFHIIEPVTKSLITRQRKTIVALRAQVRELKQRLASK